jgi:hypothetical protein
LASEYEEKSESDDNEKGLADDKQHRGLQMAATSVNRGRRNKRDKDDNINDVNSDDNGQEQEMTRRNLSKGVRKRIFDNISNEDNDHDEDDEESEREQEQQSSSIDEMRKKENKIAKLKRKNKSLEIALKEMQKTSSVPSQDKTGWTGEEINFVKDINDFCKDRLYPKEKFLRNNWQEYLTNDWRSLYSVCMKHLLIPKGSDPREIWGRVIIPAVRDKYQSMKCNMNNRVKSIYMSMRILFECVKQYLLMQRPHKDYCNGLYFYR